MGFPLSVAAAALAAASPALADDPRLGVLQAAIGNPADLHLYGSIRLRGEALDGQIRPLFKANESIFVIRSVFGAALGSGPVRLVAEVWDSRAYGVTGRSAVSNGEVNVFEPVQFHFAADLGEALGKGSHLGVTAGRMMLNLGSRRLVAADDYRNTTAGYTGLRIDYAPHAGVATTIVYVLPQARLPNTPTDVWNNRFALDRESFDQILWGGIAGFANVLGTTSIEASGFRLIEHDTPGRPTRDRNLTTIDLRLVRPAADAAFDHDVELAWQWGDARPGLVNTVPVQNVAAWFVHAEAGYRFVAAWQPRLAFRFDAISGDRPGGRYTRFDTLFGMRRADFSPGSILSAIGRANMIAPALHVDLQPTPNTDAFTSARAMWAESGSDVFSQSGVRDPAGASGRFAGFEFDSRVRHWLVKDRLRAEADATLFLRRGILRDAPNAPAGATTLYGSVSLIALF